MRNFGLALLAVATLLSIEGCSKSNQDEGRKEPSTTTASGSSAAGTAASASPGAAATASSAPTHANAAATKWGGTYKSTAAGMYVPHDAPNKQDWASVKWSGDESTTGLGDGAVTLAIDDAGRVTGTLEGPLGPATVNGSVADKQLTAQIEPVTPGDQGFTGTAVATVGADAIEGTMRLSSGRANVLRTTTFTLRKK